VESAVGGAGAVFGVGGAFGVGFEGGSIEDEGEGSGGGDEADLAPMGRVRQLRL